MSRTSALMCRLASLVYRCAQTLNTNVHDLGQMLFDKGLRQGTSGQSGAEEPTSGSSSLR